MQPTVTIRTCIGVCLNAVGWYANILLGTDWNVYIVTFVESRNCSTGMQTCHPCSGGGRFSRLDEKTAFLCHRRVQMQLSYCCLKTPSVWREFSVTRFFFIFRLETPCQTWTTFTWRWKWRMKQCLNQLNGKLSYRTGDRVLNQKWKMNYLPNNQSE